MSRGTKQRAVRIEDELWDAAQSTASERGENLSNVIRDALRAYIKETNTDPNRAEHSQK